MEEFDLLIIGGGINGSGVARDAAGRGLKVLLCEKDDLMKENYKRSLTCQRKFVTQNCKMRQLDPKCDKHNTCDPVLGVR